jgi:hypothetical protein
MLRRLALLLVPMSLAIAWSYGCGGTKDFTFDAGGIDAGPGDAGPCDPFSTGSSNCGSGHKCTIFEDGGPICGPAGSTDEYGDCTDDSNCKAGTSCLSVTYTGFYSGKHCYAFCDLSKQDGGTTCDRASDAAQCLNINSIPEGICDIPDAG